MRVNMKKKIEGKPQFGIVSRSTPITGMADAKLKFKSDNGDYVTKMKTDADGNVIKSKARRTIGGFLRGAPRLKDNLKKGGSVGKSKMKMGGSLKPVDSSKNPGLAKLPTEVRNKMGYKKKGGSVKMKMGGSCGTPKSLKKK